MPAIIPRNQHWIFRFSEGDNSAPYARIQVAILQDIRAELRSLRALFEYPNAQRIPRYLREIAKNTTRRKRVRKVVTER